MSIRRLIPLLTLFALIGCDRTPARPIDNASNNLIAYTDATSYYYKEGYVQVNLTVENQTDSVAYFEHCGERYITVFHLYSNGKWEERGGWGWPCLAFYSMGKIPLEPSSIYSDVLHISETGKYRFLLLYQWEPHLHHWSDTLYSNEFTVQ